jgi:type II secretory pathway component PulF
MKRFNYQAIDAAGIAVSGTLEAGDEAAALVVLTGRGFSQCVLTPSRESTGAAAMSRADAAELTTQLAELTNAQLPLASGLRAWRQELPPGRLASAVDRLAQHLERGVSLQQALERPDMRAPAHLRGLLATGLNSGQLGLVLEQFLAHERLSYELHRRLRSAIAYPLMLALALAAWCLFVSQVLVKGLVAVYKEFGIEFPAMTRSLFWVAEYGPRIVGASLVCVLTLIVLAWLIGGRRLLSDLVAAIPLFGPLRRETSMAEGFSMLSLLLEHSTPLPDALRWTAVGLRDAGVADAFETAAEMTSRGQPFSECIGQLRRLPPSLLPMVAWGEQSSAQPDVLRAAAEMLRARLGSRQQFIATVVPPITFILIGVTVVYTASALLLPLIRFMNKWIWYSWGRGQSIDVFSPAAGLALIGLVLQVAVWLAYGLDGPRHNPIYSFLRLFGGLLFLVGLVTTAVVSVFGVPLLLVAAVVYQMVWVQRRRHQQQSLLAILALATEKGIPLPATIHAFALEHRGDFVRKARGLAEQLRRGASLADAIQREPGALPPATQLSAQIGDSYGRLGTALRQQVLAQGELRPIRQSLASQFPYLLILLSTMPVAVAFMVIKIAPAYEKIFADFGIELPRVTRWFLQTLHNPLTHWVLAVVVCGAFVLLILGSLWYIGWLRWRPPGLGRLLERFDRATILRALVFPVEQRRPLGPMVDLLAVDYPSRSIRRRLAKAASRIASGKSWVTSLKAVGLVGSADAPVLEAAEGVGNLSWALGEMADSNERRLLYRLEVWSRIGSVLIVGAFGMLTFVFAVAFFQPLVDLIWSLSSV